MSRKIVLLYPQLGTSIIGGGDDVGVIKERLGLAPPLGLLYLAAELVSAGYHVEVIDFNSEPYSKQYLGDILRETELVGLSALSYNCGHLGTVIQDIRDLAHDLPVMVGGPDITIRPRLIEGADVCVAGEAEKTIVDIVDTMLRGGDLSRHAGTIYRDGSRSSVHWGRDPYVEKDLDSIQFPARHLLQSNGRSRGYTLLGRALSDKITIGITSRGCPFSCTFCAHGALSYNMYRERSVENVVDELEVLNRQGYEVLGIVDDSFTLNRNRVVRIMEGILERKLRLYILVEGRVDSVDEELLRLMRRAGVRGIYFGLESANQDVLDFYDKRTTVDQNRRAVEMADKVGIYTAGSFILGAPLETRAHMERTVRFATDLPLDLVSFSGLEYAFGSRLWRQAVEDGAIAPDEIKVRAGSERGLGRFPADDIERWCFESARRFYFRPRYWLRVLSKSIRMRDPYLLRFLGAGLRLYLKGEL